MFLDAPGSRSAVKSVGVVAEPRDFVVKGGSSREDTVAVAQVKDMTMRHAEMVKTLSKAAASKKRRPIRKAAGLKGAFRPLKRPVYGSYAQLRPEQTLENERERSNIGSKLWRLLRRKILRSQSRSVRDRAHFHDQD